MQDNQIIVPELNEETIKSKIYEIRGQKVMLDFELAEIYGYSTKRFNEQVKNNVEKFPVRYRFQLNKDEVVEISRSKKSTTIIQEAGIKGGRVYMPYAFTEQGIYMLMTVLKGELATRQSIALIDTFKRMKDYIVSNDGLNASLINDKFSMYDKRLDKVESKLDLVMENFIDPSTYKHFLILDGEKIEADVAYQQIYKMAKHSLYIIDDYIDTKTFDLLKIAKDIKLCIITDNKNKRDIAMLLKDANLNATVLKNGRCHDRYIIIDYNTKYEKLYLSGASSKDAGNKVTTITRIENIELYHPLIDEMLKA